VHLFIRWGTINVSKMMLLDEAGLGTWTLHSTEKSG